MFESLIQKQLESSSVAEHQGTSNLTLYDFIAMRFRGSSIPAWLAFQEGEGETQPLQWQTVSGDALEEIFRDLRDELQPVQNVIYAWLLRKHRGTVNDSGELVSNNEEDSSGPRDEFVVPTIDDEDAGSPVDEEAVGLITENESACLPLNEDDEHAFFDEYAAVVKTDEDDTEQDQEDSDVVA